MSLRRPDPSEHDAYYRLYIDQAPEGEILDVLERELRETLALLNPLTEEQERYRYQPGKWSVREVVGHLIDTEWVFSFRGLAIARTDPAEMPGFDQDLWSRAAGADGQPLSQLLDAFACARRSSLALFRTFDAETWARQGMANGVGFTVRTMPYILAGHEIHHRKVLRDKYSIG